MHEHILSTFCGRHEAEALGRIVPLNGTLHLHGRATRRTTARSAAANGRPARYFRRRHTAASCWGRSRLSSTKSTSDT